MALDRLTIITSSGLSTVSDYVIDGLRAVGVVTASTVQVGAATTVHTTGVDLGSGNITSHNINSTGIITATGIDVKGILSYEDVTNVDSVGVITARSGINVIGGSVGIGTDNPTAKLTINPLTTLSTSGDIGGVSIANTENKTYPTTSSFAATLGLNQNIEVGGTQVIDSSTPGGFNYISGIKNALTKTNDNTQDVERSYYYGLDQSFNWQDQNTCKQYVSIGDGFTYAGINTNGRTSSSFNVGRITLSPPEGGTQTITNVTTDELWLWGNSTSGTDTVNITNVRGKSVDLRFLSFYGGTHNYNITNYSAFETPSYWGTSVSTGTLNATITNYYGLKLTAPSSSTGLTVTNNYGVYSGWSESKNYFAGNLGINNTSPGTKLAIGDSTIDSSNVLTFGKRVAGSNSNLPVIGHHSDGSGSGIAICATSTDGKIHFFTGNGSAGFGDGSNAERMRIDASGNVCIGDNLTPNRLLHLKKASSTAYSGGSDTADYNFLKIENTTNDKSAGIFFAIGSNGEAAITATEVVDGNTDIAFQNRGGGVRSEKVRITSAGNVGIGTAVPITSGGYANLSLAKTNGGQVEFKKLSSGRTHYVWGDDNLNIGASYSGGGGGLIVKVNGNNERLRINGDGRVSIGGVTSPLGALHIEANQGTDTALWIGDNSSNRYLAINEQSSSSSFNHIHTRYNDNAIHAHYILDNPYASGTGYGSQILFRGYNQGTTAYIETSNEAASTARGTLRLRGADNHGLDVRSTGEVTTSHASNIGYQSNAATNTRSLVYQSRDPQRQEPTASDWYILKSFWPSKSGTVNMHAEMYIKSGTYYFSFRVREEGTNEIVFNAGDNGGYGAYSTNGNAVHSYRIYKWVCPKIKAHKRYYIEMAATNAAGTAGPYTSVGQWLYLKNFSVYSMSPGHSDGTEAMQIGQSHDVSSATANSGTTHDYISPSVNRDSINVTQYFAGTESTFLGWFTTRAYNRYLDFELNMTGSYMWFAQAYGYLYSSGQVAGSMISGYTYSGNTILNKFSVALGNRGWYGSYRTSNGNLCLKFDRGSNGYSEGKLALFLGTHGPTNPEWRVLRYRQNDTTSNIF